MCRDDLIIRERKEGRKNVVFRVLSVLSLSTAKRQKKKVLGAAPSAVYAFCISYFIIFIKQHWEMGPESMVPFLQG